MHVLVIPSWYPSGPDDVGGSFFREQAHGLSRAGCRVGVIYPQLRSLKQPRAALLGQRGVAVEDDEGIPTLRYHGVSWYPKLPSLQSRQWRRYGRALYSAYVARFGKPDIIHAHSLLHAGCLARDLMHSERVPYVVTEHSSAYARGLVNTRQREPARCAAKEASRAFAVSEAMCEILYESLGRDTARWEVLPNVVSEQFLQAPLPAPRAAGSKITFLHISLLDPIKAVDTLINAFAHAFGPDDAVELCIGGDGAERSKLEALAGQLGLSDRVIFLGALSRDAVVRAISECDAFVLTSRYETFGVVLIEALALGKPVIATRSGGPESIVRAQDGLLVPVDDVVALGAAMQQLSARLAGYDPAVIRVACAERYSAGAINQKLIAAYESVMAGAGRMPKGGA